jgi:hypothetical protein
MIRKSLLNISLAFLALAPTLTLAQTPQPKTMLSVEGYSGQAPVVRINGKTYVEIDALARATNGTVTFQAGHIILSFPPPGAVSAPGHADSTPKLSKDFLKALIDELSVIGEWRAAIANAIQGNGPVTEQGMEGYKRKTDNQMALTSTTASTQPDKDLLSLLRTESNNIHALSDKYVALGKTQSFVAQDALESDSVDQQVQTCARGLAAVAASGQFVDVSTCH